MSVQVLTDVFRYSEATLAARLVLIAVADAAHDDGVAWPQVATLCAKARLSDSTVRKAIGSLEDDGELEVKKVQRGQKRVSVYRVLMPNNDDVDYSRLPFVLDPFLRPPKFGGGDRYGSAVAGADIEPPLAGARVNGRTSKEAISNSGNVSGTARAGRAESEPPPIVHVDGRNVPLDALCVATGIDDHSPRYQQAIVALSGRLDKRGELKEPGIRHLFWLECVRYAEANDRPDRLDAAYSEPERWALALARRIEQKAAKYASVYRDAAISPKALREHWLDLELASDRRGGGGMTPGEMERYERGDA